MQHKLTILVYPGIIGTQTLNGVSKPLSAIELHNFGQLVEDMQVIKPDWAISLVEGRIGEVIDKSDLVVCFFGTEEDINSCFNTVNKSGERKIFLLGRKISQLLEKFNLAGILDSRYMDYYDAHIATGSDYFPKSPYSLIGRREAIRNLQKKHKVDEPRQFGLYSEFSLKHKPNNLAFLLLEYIDNYLIIFK